MTDAQEIRADNGEVQVGQIFEGRFEILSVLGQGGMGMVYRARHTHMDKIVAMKTLVQGAVYDDISFLRFEQEARTAASLEHPNIITIYDFGRTKQGLAYLVMEYINGPTLEDVIVEIDSLPLPRFMRIFGQACEGMQHAHKKGIIHRDLKPSNLMLYDAEDFVDKVKIVDFGLAKLAQDDTQKLTQSGMVMGSPLYMSPEQGRGDELDTRSDIYSLGCVMYVALSGHVPLKGNNSMATIYKHISDVPPLMSQVAPDIHIPRRLEQLVMRTLEKDPALRPQSMAELHYEMNEAITSTDSTKPVVMPTVPADLGKTVPSGHGINAANMAHLDSKGSAGAGAQAGAQTGGDQAKPQSSHQPPQANGQPTNNFKIILGAAAVVLLGFAFMQMSSHNGSAPQSQPSKAIDSATQSTNNSSAKQNGETKSSAQISASTNNTSNNDSSGKNATASSGPSQIKPGDMNATQISSTSKPGNTKPENSKQSSSSSSTSATDSANSADSVAAAKGSSANSSKASAPTNGTPTPKVVPIASASIPSQIKGELSTEKSMAHKLVAQYGAQATAALKAGDLDEALPWLEKQLQQERIIYASEIDPHMIVTFAQLIHATRGDQFAEGTKQAQYLELALKAFAKDKQTAIAFVDSKSHSWKIWKSLADACFTKANLLPGPFKLAYQEWATVFYSLAESKYNGAKDRNYFEMLSKTYICAKKSGNLELCGKVGAILSANGQQVPSAPDEMQRRLLNRQGPLREFGRRFRRPNLERQQ